MSHLGPMVRNALGLALSLLVVAACSENDSSVTASSGVANLGRYEVANIGLGSRDNSAIALGDEQLLMFGGVRADEAGKLENLNDGAVYDFQERSSVPVPPWPFDSAPFQPAAVWTGTDFVIVGTPCGTPPPADLVDVSCDAELQAAAYSPTGKTWRPLESPTSASGQGLPEDAVLAIAEGLSDGVALFRLGTYEDSHVVGFDVVTERWRGYGPLGKDTDTACFTDPYLHRIRSEGLAISAERLIPKSGEWESVQASSLSAPSTSVALDCVWTQGFARRYEGAELRELLLLDGAKRAWISIPAPPLQVGTLSIARLPDAWIIWPAADAGRPQILQDGDSTWRTIDSAPDLNSPVRMYAGQQVLFVVERNDSGISLGVLPLDE